METESELAKVEKIIQNMRKRGDEALVEYAKEFENVTLKKGQFQVTPAEIRQAYDRVDRKVVEPINVLSGNIKRVHEAQLPKRIWSMEISPGLSGGSPSVDRGEADPDSSLGRRN